MYVASKHNLNKINDDTPVMLNGQPIPRIHSIPCLGVTLDETLSWESKNILKQFAKTSVQV